MKEEIMYLNNSPMKNNKQLLIVLEVILNNKKI